MADAPNKNPVAIRTLVINMMFSGFVSLVVFVIGTYFFIIPHLYGHEQRLQSIEARIQQADDDEADEADEAGEPGENAAPAQDAAVGEKPAVPAPAEAAPAPAPAPAPAAK